MISVVTPWRTLLSAFGLIGSVKSEWVFMSIKPGATASPAASMIFRAVPAMPRPIAAMRPPAMATSSPAAPALPAPSNNIPPRMMKSYTAPDCRGLVAPPSGRRQVDSAKWTAPSGRRPDAYFNAVETLEKVALSCVPRPWTTAMMATAMPAAISPYSIAVAAQSSSRKLRTNALISSPNSRTVVPGRHNAQLPIVECLTAPTCGRSRAQCPPLKLTNGKRRTACPPARSCLQGFMHSAKAGPVALEQVAASMSAFLLMAMVPPGQVTEISFSPGLQVRSQLLAWPQPGWRSACRPLVPEAPGGPAGPIGPVSPLTPCGPCGPASPCGPAGPCEPSKQPASANAATRATIANEARMENPL